MGFRGPRDLSDAPETCSQAARKMVLSHPSNWFVKKYREKFVLVINAVTQKHIEGEIYFFDSTECRTSNLKREWEFSRNFSPNRRIRRTGSGRSVWV